MHRPFSELALAVLAERFHTDRRKRDCARRALGLGRHKAKRSADPLKRLDYLQLGLVQIDVLPADNAPEPVAGIVLGMAVFGDSISSA